MVIRYTHMITLRCCMAARLCKEQYGSFTCRRSSITSRSGFDRIVNVLNKKIALQSISAKGITADHMKRSAEFVAEELSKVGRKRPSGAVPQSRWHARRMGSHRIEIRQRRRTDRASVRSSRRTAGTRRNRVEHRPVRRHCNRHPPVRARRGRRWRRHRPSIQAHCRPSATI